MKEVYRQCYYLFIFFTFFTHTIGHIDTSTTHVLLQVLVSLTQYTQEGFLFYFYENEYIEYSKKNCVCFFFIKRQIR